MMLLNNEYTETDVNTATPGNAANVQQALMIPKSAGDDVYPLRQPPSPRMPEIQPDAFLPMIASGCCLAMNLLQRRQTALD